ncbi:MAG: GPW/gp25 family protein [Pseudomonadota bacterium]|nr:GPW/gp25 family protein [Pseudomonadota bacterium]
MPRLSDPGYLAFPFRVKADGARTSGRAAHVREQIEQVLFTDPGERVFRPEFGIGVRSLVFEPNNSPLWEVTKKRLLASLAEALHGEVDPRTLVLDVYGEEEKLFVVISYTLAAIGHQESHRFEVTG